VDSKDGRFYEAERVRRLNGNNLVATLVTSSLSPADTDRPNRHLILIAAAARSVPHFLSTIHHVVHSRRVAPEVGLAVAFT
jgi:hypothetical protein